MTKQRKLIDDIIQKNPHITAEDIFLKAKQIMSSIALGTVYSNLGIMARENEILKIPLANGADRYDKTTKPHDHALCTVCGTMKDIPETNIKELLEERLNMKISSYNLNIYFQCPKCLKEQKIKI